MDTIYDLLDSHYRYVQTVEVTWVTQLITAVVNLITDDLADSDYIIMDMLHVLVVTWLIAITIAMDKLYSSNFLIAYGQAV